MKIYNLNDTEMIKKLILPFAIFALMATSCISDVKDSEANIPYLEYNLIEDLQDLSAQALASECNYKLHYNISKNVIDLTASDIIINNQKLSFETDTMGIRPKTFGENLSYMGFSSSSNIGKGATVTNFSGFTPAYYIPYTGNIFSSNYKFEYTYDQRLQLEYVLNDRYHVTTFWPQPCFVGRSYVSEGAASYATKDTGYWVSLDFSKKTANVYILGVQLSVEQDSKEPKVIVLQDVPIVMSHNGFYLDSEAPKSTVPGIVDNKTAFVETTDYKVTEFSLKYVSSDFTDVNISYKVAGKNVSFQGCSIIKSVE